MNSQRPLNIMISAGEASGDIHAARLIKALKQASPRPINFTFLGGDEMADATGKKPLIHYRDMAFMGFVDVVLNLKTVLNNLSVATKALTGNSYSTRPDVLILVDYPSFNLRLARKASQLGIPCFWYISPKVWAWKEGRVKQMKKYVRHVLSILPFEPQFFKKRHGWNAVTYIGNPSVGEVDNAMEVNPSVSRQNIIALLPGSRRSEITANLPTMIEVAGRHPDFKPIIARAPAINDNLYEQLAPGIELFEAGASPKLLKKSTAALVTSGTATLETALTSTPQVVLYRSNAPRFFLPYIYRFFKRMLKVDFVSLPNLIVGREIIAEMLLHDCTVDKVDHELSPLLDSSSSQFKAQLEGYDEMRHILGNEDAAQNGATIILSSLSI